MAIALRSVLESALERHLGWIAAADTKTAFLLTVGTAMLGLEAAVAPPLDRWTLCGTVTASIPVFMLLVGLCCLGAAVFPRTTGPKRSLLYFGDVSELPLVDFRRRVQALTEEDYLSDLTEQCHINAGIAATKYTWIKRATVLLYAAIVPWLLAVFLLFANR